MAAELKTLGIESKLVEGGRGVFDVLVDGKTIFSKHQIGRFPEANELSELLEKA